MKFLISIILLFPLVSLCNSEVDSLLLESIELKGNGNYRESLELLNGAREIEPTNPSIFNLIGICYRELGTLDSAIINFKNAVRLYHPDSIPGCIYYNLGWCYYKIGQFDSSLTYHEKSLEYNLAPPLREIYLYQYSEVLCAANFNRQAIDVSREILALNPNNSNALFTIGLSFLNLFKESGDTGLIDSAITNFESIAQPGPSDYYNIACAYSLKGDSDMAIENLSNSIELNPKYRIMAGKDADFNAISDDQRFIELIGK